MKNEVMLVEPSELRAIIREELNRLFDILKQNSSKDEWIDSKDVPAYLNVSRKTWQGYRDRRLIPFSQVGRKIKVKKSDLDRFLDSYMVSTILYTLVNEFDEQDQSSML